MRISPKRFMEAYLTVSAFESDVLIADLTSRNRAFHNDIVVVELLPKVFIITMFRYL